MKVLAFAGDCFGYLQRDHGTGGAVRPADEYCLCSMAHYMSNILNPDRESIISAQLQCVGGSAVQRNRVGEFAESWNCYIWKAQPMDAREKVNQLGRAIANNH